MRDWRRSISNTRGTRREDEPDTASGRPPALSPYAAGGPLRLNELTLGFAQPVDHLGTTPVFSNGVWRHAKQALIADRPGSQSSIVQCRRRDTIPSVRPRRVAPSPLAVWRRACRRVLQYGQPACAGQWRSRRGSGEPPCMQRRFPSMSCPSPGRGSDRRGSARCVRRRLVLRSWCGGARVRALGRPPWSPGLRPTFDLVVRVPLL